MQPETYKTLYTSLLNINARVKAALGEDDAQTFMQLAEKHRNIMNKLDQKGLSQDTELLDLVEEARIEWRISIHDVTAAWGDFEPE